MAEEFEIYLSDESTEMHIRKAESMVDQHYHYKCRAEVVIDAIEFFWKLFTMIDPINELEIMKQGGLKVGAPLPTGKYQLGKVHINSIDEIPFPDAEVEWETNVPPAVMYGIMENLMNDAHVMIETLNRAGEYDGERKEGGWLR